MRSGFPSHGYISRRSLAGLVELGDAESLDVRLATKAQLSFDLDLDRLTMLRYDLHSWAEVGEDLTYAFKRPRAR